MTPTKLADSGREDQKPEQFNRMTNEEFRKKLNSVGDMLRRNVVSANKGNETNKLKEVDKAYSAFMEQIKNQREAMKNATEDQREIFKEITEEFIKLRKDEKMDFGRANKEFSAAVSTIHEKEGPGEVKDFLERLAGIGMKHTEEKKKTYVELAAEQFFKPTKDQLDNPIWRKMAGLDKRNNAKIVSPIEAAKNIGIAEKIKTELGDDITGEGERDKSILEKMAETMAGKGNGKFPETIENLSVNNLIVKMVRRDEEGLRTIEGPKALEYQPKGKQARPVTEKIDGEIIASRTNHGDNLRTIYDDGTPKLEYHGDKKLVPHVAPKLIEHRERDLIGHNAPKQLGYSKHDAEDVEFKEKPSIPAIVQRNPHAKLKTDETPMAKAVRGALNYREQPIEHRPTIIDAFTSKSDLVGNDAGVRAADATKYTEKDVEDVEPSGAGNGSIQDVNLPNLGSKGLKGVGKKLLKGGAVLAAGAAAYEGISDELDGKRVESLSDIVPEGTLSKLNPFSYAMNAGRYVGNKINKGVESLTGGESLGSKIYDWTHPEQIKKATANQIQFRQNTTGDQISKMNAEQTTAAKQAPVVVNQPAPPAPPAPAPTFVPMNGSARSRETYFDRQMITTFQK